MTDLDLTALLRTTIAGEDLPASTVEDLFGRLVDGELSEVWKSAFLVALAAKGESVAEIAGAARAMRSRASRITHASSGVIDTCGTGGDGRGTFNISTAAALVAAAGGARVAKHGNRAVSSRSGSADVLAALGVRLSGYTEPLGRCLDEVGIVFLFAPMLHPAMAQVMPVRKELGVRTLFNVLGPLTNPAGAKRQLIGVFAPDLVEPIARVLLELGSEHALVVHGDGLDEMTTTGTTAIAEVRGGEVSLYEVRPRDFGIAEASPEDLVGGDPAGNVELMRGVLGGGGGALADITCLNAGAALYVAGRADSLAAGVAGAFEVQRSGAAAAKLEALVGWTGWDAEAGRLTVVSEVPDILRRICDQRRRRVPAGGRGAESGSACVSAASRLAPDTPGRHFLDAIGERRGSAVIAEIKMGSPKLGDLRGRFDPAARAATYRSAGAACLSVVVEPDHFHGSYELLADCVAASGLPAVAKDFVVSDVQLAWARDAGASAVLLIAALYDPPELRRLARLARDLGLVPLVETHDDADFEKLGGADCPEWELVGINNRDLRTFEVDLERSAERVGRLPASALKVAESGIHSGADVARLREAGFDAFLIGERLVLSGDPAAALAELLGEPATSGATR